MKKSVFIAIYCESNFYKNYTEICYEKRQTIIPLVIMMNRWDGKIGFIGGQVDESETTLEAIIREVKEEAGFELNGIQKKNIKKVCCSIENNHQIDFFQLSLSEIEFKCLLNNQQNALHYLTEGHLMAVHFINYVHKKSFDNFMKNNFSATAKNEIIQLVKHLNWGGKYNLF